MKIIVGHALERVEAPVRILHLQMSAKCSGRMRGGFGRGAIEYTRLVGSAG